MLADMGFQSNDDFSIAFWWQPHDLSAQNMFLLSARREANQNRGLALNHEYGPSDQ